MDSTTISSHYRPLIQPDMGLAAQLFDFSVAFGKKVTPLAAGCALACLISSAVPTVAALCLTAGAIWTAYLVIKPLCSYAITLFHPASESLEDLLKKTPEIWHEIFLDASTARDESSEFQTRDKPQELLKYYQNLGIEEGRIQFNKDREIFSAISRLLDSTDNLNLIEHLEEIQNKVDGGLSLLSHFNQFSNSKESYSSTNQHHSTVVNMALPKMNTHLMQRDKIISDFDKDLERNMEFTATSLKQDVSFHVKTGGGEYLYERHKHRILADEIRFDSSTEPDTSQKLVCDKKKLLSASCRDAIYELSNQDDLLTTAALDLTTQTTGNALWSFINLVYSSKRNHLEMGPVDPHYSAHFDTKDDGSIAIKLMFSASGYNTSGDRYVYQIGQPIKVTAYIQLDPDNLDQRTFDNISVEFGDLSFIDII